MPGYQDDRLYLQIQEIRAPLINPFIAILLLNYTSWKLDTAQPAVALKSSLSILRSFTILMSFFEKFYNAAKKETG